jgi:murein DD-endopeptidase MepM/ murein hydrolase activator NlpD
MQIEIHLPRPGLTAITVAAVLGWGLYLSAGAAPQAQTASVIEAPAMGMPMSSSSVSSVSSVPSVAVPAIDNQSPPTDDSGLSEAEMRIKWARAEQEFLRQRQDILREQLEGLQAQRAALGDTIDPQLEEQFRRSVQMLTSLVKDQQKGEQFLLMAYRQEWEAEEHAMAAATGAPQGTVAIFWPVEPSLGISAYFMDPAYKQRFKVDHYAVDIPTEQGTLLLAAADGIVKDVVDHGLGYNYITIDHGGYATVYGHVSQFSVRPGQRVRAGDPLGRTGGMPGLPGGGSSTGPHLHFGLYVNGKPVDPLKYLPKYRG